MKTYLCMIGAEDLWLSQKAESVEKQFVNLIMTFRNNLISKDINRIFNSNYNLFYRLICPFNADAFYLNCNAHVEKIRLICQLRLSFKIQTRLFIKGKKIIFDVDNICKYCNQNKDSIYHFLLHCPLFTDHRNKFLNKYVNINDDINYQVASILDIDNTDKLNNVYYFVMNSIYKTADG